MVHHPVQPQIPPHVRVPLSLPLTRSAQRASGQGRNGPGPGGCAGSVRWQQGRFPGRPSYGRPAGVKRLDDPVLVPLAQTAVPAASHPTVTKAWADTGYKNKAVEQGAAPSLRGVWGQQRRPHAVTRRRGTHQRPPAELEVPPATQVRPPSENSPAVLRAFASPVRRGGQARPSAHSAGEGGRCREAHLRSDGGHR